MAVARNALRRKLRRRACDLLGIGGYLLDERDLRLIRQQFEFRAVSTMSAPW